MLLVRNVVVFNFAIAYGDFPGGFIIQLLNRKIFFRLHSQHLSDGRGVGLAMIAIDPQDNSAAGIVDDARGEQEAKIKIESIYQQLRMGADFATLAKTESEDANSLERGG